MKTTHTVAEVRLSYKTVAPLKDLPVISTPLSAYTLLKSLWDDDSLQLQEHFLILLLDVQKR